MKPSGWKVRLISWSGLAVVRLTNLSLGGPSVLVDLALRAGTAVAVLGPYP